MINNFIKVILAVTSLSFSAAAMSQSLSEDEYRSLKKDIASDFQADLAYCTSYVGKEKKHCERIATSKAKLALAALDASYVYLITTPLDDDGSLAQRRGMAPDTNGNSQDETDLVRTPVYEQSIPAPLHGYL